MRLALHRPALECEQIAYAELFAQHLSVDVFSADVAQLQQIAVARNVIGAEHLQLERDAWLDLLLSHFIQPLLGRDSLCFVADYPASQASLARLNEDGTTAARFEVFYRGIELANGFHELTDGGEQAARFEADNCIRRSRGQSPVRVDRQLLAAMEHGLPDCAGVAVGLDRVLMLRQGMSDLDAVLGFSLERC